jgi:NTE family protein
MTSTERIHDASKATLAGELPGQVVLVLQGGGALGAYQGGVYQALHEAGIEPDWVVGTSIGAINGAIIAGNDVAHRLERLREFWSHIERRPSGWAAFSPDFENLTTRLTTTLTGVPGFFALNLATAFGLEARVGVEQASVYSIDPLKQLLPHLVDFDLVNSGKPRFTLGLVNVESGQMRYFDSREETIGLDHVLGSSALPPSFPAVRIDGEAYWDGGVFSNSPVEVVFDDNPRRNSVVFAVQIWPARGAEPKSVMDVLSRQKDIWLASRTESHIARQAQIHKLRHVVRELFRMLPEDQRRTLQARKLASYGCATVMHLVAINAAPADGEDYHRDIDFSQAAIRTRWEAGYADTRRSIARRPWEQPVDPTVGVTLHASDAEPQNG